MGNINRLDIEGYTKFLPTQYGDSEKLIKFLSVFLKQIQDLEDSNVDLDKYSTDITLAYGYQLDIIGKLLGILRKGRTDAQYREAIYFKIAINTGNGTPENCMQYLSNVTKASNINYWEHYPASVILETNGTNIPSNIPNTLDNITPAGVSVGGVISSQSGEVFRGSDVTDAFNNYVDIPSPLNSVEVGGVDAECGNLLAELTYIGFTGFVPVLDTDPLSRCIFPDLVDPSTKYFGYLGNILADSFGDLNDSGVGSRFISALEAPIFNTTQGVFADVYIK